MEVDRERAEATANRILGAFGLLDGPEQTRTRYKSVRAGMFLADVEFDAQVFSRQLSMARDEGVGFPCIRKREIANLAIPLDIFDFARGTGYLPTHVPFRRFESFRSMIREMRFLFYAFTASPQHELIELGASPAKELFASASGTS